MNKLKKNFGVTDEEIEKINDRVKNEVAEAVQFAEESPYPDDDEALKDVYAEDDYPFITD